LIYTGVALGFPAFNGKIKAFGTIRKIFRAISSGLHRGALKSTVNTFFTGRKTKGDSKKYEKNYE
jgi:hypothetical protein